MAGTQPLTRSRQEVRRGAPAERARRGAGPTPRVPPRPSGAPSDVPGGAPSRPHGAGLPVRASPLDSPPLAHPAPPLPALDRLIHERLRLGIVSALAVNESLSFNDLKHLLGTTDGNLSVHARKLEEAAYITCSKYFVGRQPKTEYRLTAAGRAALQRYLDYMESLIRATRSAEVAR